jgi:hypothetical protein
LQASLATSTQRPPLSRSRARPASARGARWPVEVAAPLLVRESRRRLLGAANRIRERLLGGACVGGRRLVGGQQVERLEGTRRVGLVAPAFC